LLGCTFDGVVKSIVFKKEVLARKPTARRVACESALGPYFLGRLISDPQMEEGKSGLQKVVLHYEGTSAEIYLLGAHVTSFKTKDGVERLFLSEVYPFVCIYLQN